MGEGGNVNGCQVPVDIPCELWISKILSCWHFLVCRLWFFPMQTLTWDAPEQSLGHWDGGRGEAAQSERALTRVSQRLWRPGKEECLGRKSGVGQTTVSLQASSLLRKPHMSRKTLSALHTCTAAVGVVRSAEDSAHPSCFVTTWGIALAPRGRGHYLPAQSCFYWLFPQCPGLPLGESSQDHWDGGTKGETYTFINQLRG